jgi:hypothetical protein
MLQEFVGILLYGYFGQFGVHGYFVQFDILFNIYNKMRQVDYYH